MLHTIVIVNHMGCIMSLIAEGYDLNECGKAVAAFKRKYKLASGCYIRNVARADVVTIRDA
jgi:hypothetical protein